MTVFCARYSADLRGVIGTGNDRTEALGERAFSRSINSIMTNPNTDQLFYRIQQSGPFTVNAKHDAQPATFDLGIVEKGPRRVFAGYFVEIAILGGERLVAVDENSMVLALGRLQKSILSRGLRLDCVALSGEWFESGLSANSGWGYYGHYERLLHMMSAMPEEPQGEALDRLIRRVVGKMFSTRAK